MTRVAACLCALLVSSPAWAWGPVGHRTVGEIAQRHLTAKTRVAVEALIGPQTLADVATWPDEIRYQPERLKADPWHVIRIEDGETLASARRDPAGDILEAMARMERTLRDRAAAVDERTEALKYLTHLVGDAHQPLHVGRRADEGGHKIAVVFNGRASDLHWLWDALIINDQGYSYGELARAIDHPSPAELAAWQSASFEDWIEEALALRAVAYAVPADGQVNYLYGYQRWPLIQQRLLRAGVRLAGRLNAIFDSPRKP